MSSPPVPERLFALRLGLSNNVIELQTCDETGHACDLLASQASLSLDIFSRELDPALYDRQAFLDEIARFCKQNTVVNVRILVQEPTRPAREGHRLIDLSRRLSSKIEIRQPHADYRSWNEAFLVADGCGFVHRKFSDRSEGTANFHDPTRSRRLLDFFTEVWERSEQHPEVRRLYL